MKLNLFLHNVYSSDMADNEFSTIDIDRILKSKAPGKSKYIPRFVVSYLKKIVHQDEVNYFLTDFAKGKIGVDFLDAVLDFIDIKINIEGQENLPDDGLYTFISNHPLGGLDGVAIGSMLGHKYNGKIKYLVNDLLMNLPGLAPLCIPVNKTGAQSKQFPMMVEKGFSSDSQLIMFPAGLCSRKIKGEIKDLEWKKTFLVKSIQSQRDIVPIHFIGRNSNFFYNIDRLRKMVGIKFNIAMLYLADELFKAKGSTYTIKVGKPIPYTTFDKSRSTKEWCDYVRNIVYNL